MPPLHQGQPLVLSDDEKPPQTLNARPQTLSAQHQMASGARQEGRAVAQPPAAPPQPPAALPQPSVAPPQPPAAEQPQEGRGGEASAAPATAADVARVSDGHGAAAARLTVAQRQPGLPGEAAPPSAAGSQLTAGRSAATRGAVCTVAVCARTQAAGRPPPHSSGTDGSRRSRLSDEGSRSGGGSGGSGAASFAEAGEAAAAMAARPSSSDGGGDGGGAKCLRRSLTDPRGGRSGRRAALGLFSGGGGGGGSWQHGGVERSGHYGHSVERSGHSGVASCILGLPAVALICMCISFHTCCLFSGSLDGSVQPTQVQRQGACMLCSEKNCNVVAGVSLGGGSTSAMDTDADVDSHYRSGDGSEAAAVRGWSTEVWNLVCPCRCTCSSAGCETLWSRRLCDVTAPAARQAAASAGKMKILRRTPWALRRSFNSPVCFNVTNRWALWQTALQRVQKAAATRAAPARAATSMTRA